MRKPELNKEQTEKARELATATSKTKRSLTPSSDRKFVPFEAPVSKDKAFSVSGMWNHVNLGFVKDRAEIWRKADNGMVPSPRGSYASKRRSRVINPNEWVDEKPPPNSPPAKEVRKVSPPKSELHKSQSVASFQSSTISSENQVEEEDAKPVSRAVAAISNGRKSADIFASVKNQEEKTERKSEAFSLESARTESVETTKLEEKISVNQESGQVRVTSGCDFIESSVATSKVEEVKTATTTKIDSTPQVVSVPEVPWRSSSKKLLQEKLNKSPSLSLLNVVVSSGVHAPPVPPKPPIESKEAPPVPAPPIPPPPVPARSSTTRPKSKTETFNGDWKANPGEMERKMKEQEEQEKKFKARLEIEKKMRERNVSDSSSTTSHEKVRPVQPLLNKLDGDTMSVQSIRMEEMKELQKLREMEARKKAIEEEIAREKQHLINLQLMELNSIESQGTNRPRPMAAMQYETMVAKKMGPRQEYLDFQEREMARQKELKKLQMLREQEDQKRREIELLKRKQMEEMARDTSFNSTILNLEATTNELKEFAEANETKRIHCPFPQSQLEEFQKFGSSNLTNEDEIKNAAGAVREVAHALLKALTPTPDQQRKEEPIPRGIVNNVRSALQKLEEIPPSPKQLRARSADVETPSSEMIRDDPESEAAEEVSCAIDLPTQENSGNVTPVPTTGELEEISAHEEEVKAKELLLNVVEDPGRRTPLKSLLKRTSEEPPDLHEDFCDPDEGRYSPKKVVTFSEVDQIKLMSMESLVSTATSDTSTCEGSATWAPVMSTSATTGIPRRNQVVPQGKQMDEFLSVVSIDFFLRLK